jgi:peptidoglycan/xylan/chitin deacetylase (PgdA/CDA1 family)
MTDPRPPIIGQRHNGRLQALRGRGLLVHVVVNVESWAFDRPLPRRIIGSPHGGESVPDVPNFSWVEYGMRRGLPRLIRAIAGRGLPASVSFNAGVSEDYPQATADLIATGWEFLGHGVRQEALHRVTDERATIIETLDRIEFATGARPRGWLGPGLQETDRTLELLAELGVDYVSDWTVDDVPVWLATSTRPLAAIPYSLELNDSVLFAAHDYPDSEFDSRFEATLNCLLSELDEGPRVLALPLHPHLMGVPHRIASLERALDTLTACDQAVFCAAHEIYDWFLAGAPNPMSPGSTPT